MKGKHLVTGAAGMIGSHLSRRLVGLGYDVVGVDNLLSGSLQNVEDLEQYPNWQFWKADLRSLDKCAHFTRGKDYVWNLAANMGGIGYITEVGAPIMVDNTLINLNMLRAIKINEVPNYLYSSSACVYPEYRQKDVVIKPLAECDCYPAQPDQFYGWEKLYAEKLCESHIRDYGLNIHIARFHNVYGVAYTAFDEAKSKAPCKMILRAIQWPEKTIEIWNDGKQTRSFLYIDDCIDAVLKLMVSDCREPINIGTDRLISMKVLAELVKDISGKPIVPKYFPEKAQGVRGRNADLTMVKAKLGWQPTTELEVGMAQVYQWAVEHYGELEGI